MPHGSVDPPQEHPAGILGKRYRIDDGILIKNSVASVWRGRARCVAADTAAELADRLRKITETADCAIILDGFRDAGEDHFQITTANALSRILRVSRDDESTLGGVHTLPTGGRVAARLKAGAIPSGWVLLDFDDPLGMPADMRALDYRQRLERLETIMPGISTCERIVARSSSARVRRIGEEPGLPTHAYIQLSDRRKVDIVREHLRIRSALDDDLHFWRDTAGRKADGSPVRIECGLIDFGTFGAGRIVFTAAPQLDPSAVAAGYVVHDAGVAIENEGVGPLDVTDIELPDSETLRERSARGGAHTSYNRERGGISTVERGLLTFYTPVTSRGRTRRLSEWLADMRVDQKLRCEASFRPGSVSEAAYIRKTDFFKAFLHDTGTHTSYLLPVGYEPPQPGGVAIDSLAKAHRARLLLDQGNITGARSVLECAAERGSGLALFLLAETYDPSILSAWGIFSVWGIFGRRGGRRGNVTKARKLYAKAVAAGVYEAQHRLIAPH